MPVTGVDRNPVVPVAQEARAIQEIDRALSSSPDDTHYSPHYPHLDGTPSRGKGVGVVGFRGGWTTAMRRSTVQSWTVFGLRKSSLRWS